MHIYSKSQGASVPATPLPEIFGCDVFHEAAMSSALEPEVFGAWKHCAEGHLPLPESVANPIANAMKHWALQRGATHYTHWFQPLRGITAEKHESFLETLPGGGAIESFSGRALIRGEPDASSFPTGGLRATFEARGYTVWDITAFAFFKDGSLCIPTCFYAHTGAALDRKTPLLRSIDELSREAVRILRLFGDNTTRLVIPCVGAEQEYFLINRDDYLRREDLRLTGRTLFGAPPPREQSLNDHYYGNIHPRILAFMQELDQQLWRLGIPAKTRHNEVAPCQHELAPIYSHANTACDHNQLIMELMKKTAEKHGLTCLLHEKPFAGINGSGKHNNWSLSTQSGVNLLAPGKTPEENARFMLFLAAFIKGADQHQAYLRCTAASAGNDWRLGSHEAPPAIVSIFLGHELLGVIRNLIQGGTQGASVYRRIGVDVLPPVSGETADRNRTSPLAFTGNKFEFRMLGARESISDVNIAINAMMADSLQWFADRLENAADFWSELQQTVTEALTEHQRILFDGNGYDLQWTAEAMSRGLVNLPTTAHCLQQGVCQKTIDLLTSRGIFSPQEFRARLEVQRENVCQTIRLEVLTMIRMIRRQILPSVSAFTVQVCNAMEKKRSLALPCPWEEGLAGELSRLTDALAGSCDELESALQNVPQQLTEAVFYYQRSILPVMEAARTAADRLETITEKTYWPFPAYSDLLFFA